MDCLKALKYTFMQGYLKLPSQLNSLLKCLQQKVW